MILTLAEAALGAGARLEAPASAQGVGALVASGYSIDSRTVAAGELFFAVRGERLDGHDFVVAALEHGAIGAVVSVHRVVSLPNAALAAPLLIVEDPLIALQTLAAHVRRQWGKRVVGVTGSAGKTSTKEAVAAVLAAEFPVLKSLGNLNNGFGLPLQLLRLEPEHEYAVIEMGMNHSGEIAQLCRIAAPDWGVVTNVGMAHVENFPDGQAGIARAKYELIESLPPNGVAFLNCDDRYVSQFGRDFPGKTVYFGAGPCSDPLIAAVREGDQLEIDLVSEGREATLKLSLLGRHNAVNAAAAIAVGQEAGVPLDAAIHALEQLTPGDKRGQILHLHGATIINDAYNSNPEALKAMILTLTARPATRRILVAGEMLELGDFAAELHADCGRAAAEARVDVIVGVRGHAADLVRGVTEAAVPGVATIFLHDADAAGEWLKENLRTGDVVLVKGSRGVRLERAIDALMSHDDAN
ncbi:UDP-N-acetylmuramoyl-tripeptide--D-alanyl-D-alanine ligase [Acidicapsa dinghuensis]|uniref:UDP-N-acetylmuramoyl-tripeptide--D-alanyl-D-alanine ligase n=1 Tax=Acidicapsa dinghuensis TaxID=2218256 RepID=A0ABW1EJR0_9BACT|nr:UDP-N-acetylmuramoyl-tripeptide--D-alanyl-D-alanine ligase [Acidicapsa dinghuensis]